MLFQFAKHSTRLTFSIILLIFIFPAGLFFLWKWKIGNAKIRLVLTMTIIFFIRHLIVLYMIVYGRMIYPEASSMLFHYCFGDGSKLVLSSDYFKRSPVIIRQIKEMKIGEKRKVGMKQWEDFRLSYALNPFEIMRTKKKVIISQYIKFDRSGDVLTWVGPIPIPDNIVHVFKTKPYLFYTEFEYNQLNESKENTPNFIEAYFMSKAKKIGWKPGKNYRVLH